VCPKTAENKLNDEKRCEKNKKSGGKRSGKQNEKKLKNL
jgi:hypothetical protein